MAEENIDTSESTKSIQDVLNSPEAQAMFKDMLDKEVSGLKKKNSELIGKLKDKDESLKEWDGFDRDQVKSLMERIQNDEETRLLAEGNIDEVISRRTQLLKKDYDHTLSAKDGVISELEEKLAKKNEQLNALGIDSMVREDYLKLQLQPAAMPMILREARDIFKMDDDGKILPRDQYGDILFGKDGKSPMTSKEWLESMTETHAYLRPASSGGGASNAGVGSRGFDASTATATQKIAEGLRKRGLS